MTDFTLSSLASTVAEGGRYSFFITPSAALSGATTVRWEIVGAGELPISSFDFLPPKGMVKFVPGATWAQWVSIRPHNDIRHETEKGFEIRIYQVVGVDDSGSSTETNDILLGSQAVTLTDNDAGVFGSLSLRGNSEGNILTAAGAQYLSLNGRGGNDTYIITRFQHGDVLITDTQGANLVKFDYGVSITGFSEISVNSLVSSVTLTLSTGAEIKIDAPAGVFKYQLGDKAVINSYADFKTAIDASGTNAASALAATKTIDTFTSVPNVSANVLSPSTGLAVGSVGDDVSGSGSDISYNYNGTTGDDTYIITRFQSGDISITDMQGSNLVKFDYGVSIKGFSEVSRGPFTEARLTLSTGAEVKILLYASNVSYQLGDDAVISSYAAFKTAIGASGRNTLHSTYTVAFPSSDSATTPVGAFTLSSLAATVAEGGTYSFTLTTSAALSGATEVRWEIIANGKLPISAGDFFGSKGAISFDSGTAGSHTTSITPTDDSVVEIAKNFEIRIYQVVGADDSRTAETNDILLGSQAVTLTDADAGGNAEKNIMTAATTRDISLDAGAGKDAYIITRFQHGDVTINDSIGTNLVKFDYGVSITGFSEISVNSLVSSVTLTLSTGAEIEIAAPAGGKFKYQLGGDTAINYAAFKTAIDASGTNAASVLAETKTIDSFTSVPVISDNTLAVPDVALGHLGHSEVIGFGSDSDFTARTSKGYSTYIVTRFQHGDVDIISQTSAASLVKFDYGVSIEDFAERSVTYASGWHYISSVALTLSTGAEVTIASPTRKFTYQLGDDTVINYTAFKTAIGASGTNAQSTLVNNTPYTVALPATPDSITTGTVSITHAETSSPATKPNVGEVLKAITTDLTDSDDNTLTFTYQWKLGGANTATSGTDISGATAKTYTPTAIGDYSVVVTAIDDVKNANTVFTSTATTVVAAKPKLIDASDYTEFKIGEGALADELDAGANGSSVTSAQLIQGGALGDTITASTYGDVIAGGSGADEITLGAGADTVVHRFARSGTDWTNSDGADTIKNFQRGTDKFVFVDTDTGSTPIASLSAFLAALPASDIEARVKTVTPIGHAGSFDDEISTLEIRFGTSGHYLEINFDKANLQTYASVSDSLEAVTGVRVYKVTDFAIFDDLLFGEDSFDVYATADLGFTILL